MRAETKTHIQNSIGRMVISMFSFIAQVWWIFFLAQKLKNYSAIISTASSIAAIILVIYIYNRGDTPAEFKMPWIILILAFPIAGICLYFMLGHKAAHKLRNQMSKLHKDYQTYITQEEKIIEEVESLDYGVANQHRYLYEKEGFPVYRNCDVKFFPDTNEAYKELVWDILSAKKYIFIEYHAIQNGIAFGRILNILEEKVASGVEVRVFYDDVGSIGFLNRGFAKKLNKLGIKCKAFNRITPAFRLYMNNRDHRKITIVDGEIAHTGGYNLADEYFHLTSPYGYWNDTGIRFTGEAVKSILGTYLEMWNFAEKEPEDISKYFLTDCYSEINKEGYIQPYSDTPLADSSVGENVYLNVIKNAKKTLYFTTPYLIPGDCMIRELNMAAERGVDVRIVTPGIPDKKIIYSITRSYYGQLLKSGVKIYEYSPGFMHGKQMVADGQVAVVGSINMDYRSLYHHFENAVLMYKTDCIKDISAYLENLFIESELVDIRRRRLIIIRIFDNVLRLIAPLF